MSSIKKIIILGEDEHAWFSAAMLAFNCPWLGITVLGEKEYNGGFYAACTRSDCQHFFSAIGLSWQELLFSAGATYKLANHYVNCGENTRDFFHSYGEYGADIGLLEFHQVFKALDSCFPSGGYDAFSLEAQAAKSGKFIVDNKSAWGLHYDRIALSRLLKNYAQKLGVRHIAEAIVSVDVNSANGIKEIITRAGDVHSADFYIDARTNHPNAITEKNRADAASWLRCTEPGWCVTAYLDDQQVYRPATEYRRMDEQYWIKKIPLQSRTVVELYGAGLAPSQQDFSALFSERGYLIKTDSARLMALSSGRKSFFWNNNCLSLGEASVALGNLAFPALDITKFQLERFLKYFPEVTPNYNLIAEYNRLTTQAVDNVLDYHRFIYSILFKKGFLDEEFNDLSSTLVERINFFMSTGRYELHENELIPKNEWISLFMGLGIPIKQRDSLIGVNESARLAALLMSMSAEIMKTITEMPNHLIFLSQFLQSKNKR